MTKEEEREYNRIKRKEWRDNNIEKNREIQKVYSRNYRLKYPEKYKEKQKEYNKNLRERDPEEFKRKKREYLEKNREKHNERNKLWRQKNSEKLKDYNKDYNKKWREENKDKIEGYKWKNRESARRYYHENKEKCLEQMKIWKETNREKWKEYVRYYGTDDDKKEIRREKARVYKRKKESIDPLFKLKGRIRTLISHSITKKGYLKTSKTMDILGVDFETFKEHIKRQWEPWMSWDNYGLYKKDTFNYGWDIDHIIPISSTITEEDVYKLNHYTNLKPLCSKINRDIKKDKI
jgi:hypothetical protein